MKTELKNTVLKTLTVQRPEQTVKLSYIIEREVPAGLLTAKIRCEDIQVEVQFHSGPLAGCRFRAQDTDMDHEGAILIGTYSVKGRLWRVTVYTWGDELEKAAEFYQLRQERLMALNVERSQEAQKLAAQFAELYAAVDCGEPVEDVDSLLKKLEK